jgi:integrase
VGGRGRHADRATQPEPALRERPSKGWLDGVDFTICDTVVSVLMDLGVPPNVVQAIARHSDVKITLQIYAHTNLKAMRKALNKLDGWLS